MAGRERFTLGVRLAVVLALLAVLFAGVVYLTTLDAEQMIAQVQEVRYHPPIATKKRADSFSSLRT